MVEGKWLRWRAWLPELVLLCVFISLCLIIDSRLSTRLDVDSHKYLALAERLVDAGKFEFPDINGMMQPEQGRTPVYSGVIALSLLLCGGNKVGAIALVIWGQRLIWAIVMLGLLPMIRPEPGTWRLRVLLAKGLLLLSPMVLVYGSFLLTDLSYAATVFAVTILSIKAFGSQSGYGVIGAGMMHGLLTLLRPFHVLLPFAQVVPWVKTRSRYCLILILVSAVAPAAWMTRNALVNGNLLLANLGGRALALHQEPVLRAIDPQSSESDYGPEFLTALGSTDETAITAAWILQRDYGLTEGESDQVAGDVARETIVSHPFTYIKQVIANVRRLFWSRVEGIKLAEMLGAAPGGVVLKAAGVANGAWGLVFFFVVPGLMLIGKKQGAGLNTAENRTWILTMVYLIAIPCLTTVTYGRFLLPAVPIIALIYCRGFMTNAGMAVGLTRKQKTDF